MSWKVTLTLKCGHPCSSQDNLILMRLWWNSLPELTMVMMSVDHKNDDNANDEDDEVGHPCSRLDNLQGVGHAGGNCSSGSTFIWFLKKCFSFCYFVYRARKPRHHRLLFGWVLCIFASATRTWSVYDSQMQNNLVGTFCVDVRNSEPPKAPL